MKRRKAHPHAQQPEGTYPKHQQSTTPRQLRVMLRTVACGVIATELSSVLAGAPLAPLPFFLFLQVYCCIAEIFLIKK